MVGLLVGTIVKPGRGVMLPAGPGVAVSLANAKGLSATDMLVRIFPSSVVDAMARGDVLQIVVFAVIFGLAVAAVGAPARPVVALCESVSNVMFKFTDLIMHFAPVGVGSAIAITIARQGVGVLASLALLVASLYLALVIFVAILLAATRAVWVFSLREFWRAAREPFTVAFATASSEAAFPKAMEAMVKLGVPKEIAGFVIPTGYSFNVTGSALYLSIASVFIIQAAESGGAPHLGFGRLLLLLFTLMITSKGVAGVPRGALVVLLGVVRSFGLPVEGVAVILGVDALMDMARTSVNVLGNCLASVVVARWEAEFRAPSKDPAAEGVPGRDP
jgi:proton glutamate symport protein